MVANPVGMRQDRQTVTNTRDDSLVTIKNATNDLILHGCPNRQHDPKFYLQWLVDNGLNITRSSSNQFPLLGKACPG